jgi:glycine dehydrogenase subunit 1
MALAATVYLARMGGAGLRDLAELCAQRAHWLADEIVRKPGNRLAFSAPFLWEFAVRTPRPAEELQARMLDAGVLPGLPLGRFDPALSDALLVSVTELNDPKALERFVEVLP